MFLSIILKHQFFMMLSIKQLTLSLCSVRIEILICCVLPVFQHDLTPRIYVLHKITIALKFMSYINQKLRPSYQTALNFMSNINCKFREEVYEEDRSNWQQAGITDTERWINTFQFFFVY